jgi:hypothetical protein
MMPIRRIRADRALGRAALTVRLELARDGSQFAAQKFVLIGIFFPALIQTSSCYSNSW